MSEQNYQDRTDSAAEKLRLLQQALEAGRHDLGMSLAESIKDTLSYTRQTPDQTPLIDAQTFGRVQDLPREWARWAEGWSYYKVVELSETEGLERRGEMVDIPLAFAADQVADLHREVRVARLQGGVPREVPSQIYDPTWAAGERHARLVFPADARAGGQTTFLVLYGNPLAELPAYDTDLQVRGQGYGLDIENHHYIARLSRQMGQLERLTYKRSHGLELFAGGEGHGEPPHIDWAHDYLASEKFQKFRVTNWAECPNWEIVRGPLCTKVRRWGFPHSPAHPLFTPARMHIDVTYTFYAGKPYFFKDGRMEMVQDFELNYLRDDEWVFSGYSFNQSVWMDREGKLHEGRVAAGQEEDLWATGFFNSASKDAFIALWLDHSAEGFDGLYHGGAAVLDYQGHGQLWSRWAARNDPHFKAGNVLKQYNAYLVSPYEGPGPVEETRRLLLNPLRATPGALSGKAAPAPQPLARPGETAESAPLKKALWEALRQVRDDMFYTVDANVVDMGYIYDLRVRQGMVRVLMTMTHRGRPRYMYIGQHIQKKLLQIDGVRDVVVDHTWEPAWTAERLSATGRRVMGLEG